MKIPIHQNCLVWAICHKCLIIIYNVDRDPAPWRRRTDCSVRRRRSTRLLPAIGLFLPGKGPLSQRDGREGRLEVDSHVPVFGGASRSQHADHEAHLPARPSFSIYYIQHDELEYHGSVPRFAYMYFAYAMLSSFLVRS